MEIPSGIIAHHEGTHVHTLGELLRLPAGGTSIPVELGVVIGKGGRDIAQADADSHVAGYSTCSTPPPMNSNSRCQALAVDMTARNLQEKVKKQALPWSSAKGFDTFTPVGYVFVTPSYELHAAHS